ncbi:hypothetical protein, partial [Klebsiella pneumoniae]|uniref:hypothetical protein n=1 Tax=Klebsiella pneumoniae TaxID=573 RepID=UPI00286DC727
FQLVSLPTEPHPFSARPLLRLLRPPALLWWRLRHFQRLTLHYGGKPLHCLRRLLLTHGHLSLNVLPLLLRFVRLFLKKLPL